MSLRPNRRFNDGSEHCYWSTSFGNSGLPCRRPPTANHRFCPTGSAVASRHVVETFDRPALIPRPFPPARLPS